MTATQPDDEPVPECERCGERHERSGRPTCTAHTTRGNPCRKYPVDGHHVCQTHGAGAPQVRAAARANVERRELERTIRLELVELGERFTDQHPVDGLLEQVARAAQAVNWLAGRVAELHVPNPDEGVMANVIGIDQNGVPVLADTWMRLYGPNHNGDLAIHPLWVELNRAMERHARLCKLTLDAGVNERLIRMAESYGSQIASIVVQVIDALGLEPADRDRARRIAAAKMRELGPGAG